MLAPMTTQPLRTAAANEARTRKSQNTAAHKLTTAGWICFPPEVAAALRTVIATYDEMTGWTS